MPVLEQPSDVLPQFCHGDLDAFEALFRRHQREVYGWIVRIVRDPAARSLARDAEAPRSDSCRGSLV